jgi:hypothetical protein
MLVLLGIRQPPKFALMGQTLCAPRWRRDPRGPPWVSIPSAPSQHSALLTASDASADAASSWALQESMADNGTCDRSQHLLL